MGAASSSLEVLTKEDIAEAVSSLGANFAPYAEAVIDNGLDGEILASFDDQDLLDTFEELSISSKLHRKVLKKTLDKSKKSKASTQATKISSLSASTVALTQPSEVFSKATIGGVCDESELKKYAEIAEKVLEDIGSTAQMASVNLMTDDTQHSLAFTVRSKETGKFESLLGVEIPLEASLCRQLLSSGRESIAFQIPEDYPLNAPNGDVFTGPHRYVGHAIKNEDGEKIGTVCAIESTSSFSDENNDDEQEHIRLLQEFAVIAQSTLEEGKALRYRNEKLRSQIAEKKAVYWPEVDLPEPYSTADQPIFHQGLAETEDERAHLPPNFFMDLDSLGVTHPPIRKDDMERVAAVEALGLMNLEPRDPLVKSLNNLVSMAARLFDYQCAHISTHTHDKEYAFCGYCSQDVEEKNLQAVGNAFEAMNYSCGTPFMKRKARNTSTCNYAIHLKKTLVLNDTWNDPTFSWLKGADLFRAYVGSPIFDMNGHVVAMLCIFDFRGEKNFNKTNEAQIEQIAFSCSQLIENWSLRREMDQLERERTLLEKRGLSHRKTSPPRGEATIVLTDVQGSTSLWEADPSAMQDALKLHDEIMRSRYKENYGYEITTEGDAFLLAFHDPVDAIRFSLEAQVLLHEANWSDEILKFPDASDDGSFRGLRVRMGIHCGPVSSEENEVTGRMEYKGETWNIAKNIEAMSHGGQILVTADAWRVASWVAETLDSPQVVDVGEHVVGTGKAIYEGIISKRVIQLVPKQLAFDYFTSRRHTWPTSHVSGPDGIDFKTTKKETLTGRTFPPPLSKRKLRASFYDAPYENGEVAVAFIYTSEVKDQVDNPDSVLGALSKFFTSVLVDFDGYECKTGMYVFDSPTKAVQFGLKVVHILKDRPLEGRSNLTNLLKVGVHSGVFTSMGPNPTTGRADYYGQVVNRAARVAGAANLGEVCIGILAEDKVPDPPILGSAIEVNLVGLRSLKGVTKEMAIFSCSCS